MSINRKEKPEGWDEIELAQKEEELERKFKDLNTPRPGEKWAPADFIYDPM